VLLIATGVMCLACLWGCSDQIRPPSSKQVAEFADAGPTGPSVDVRSLIRARLGTKPYRVAPDEVLELTMPAILKVVTADQTVPSGETAPYPFRISPKGTIILPVVGEVVVEGLTLFEIEVKVAQAYYPTYTKTYPAVHAKVVEYKTYKVSITGAVQRPGTYDLRSDQMSLVSLIMAAGGIAEEGAGLIRISRTQENAVDLSKPEALSGIPLSQTIGDRARWDGSVGMVSDAVDATPDLEMSFRPLYSHSTLGQLRVSRRGRILAGGEVDLASQAQRQAVLQTVYASDPTASIGYLDRQMASLAERLEVDLTTGNLATLASAIEGADVGRGPVPRSRASVVQGLTLTAGQEPQLLRSGADDRGSGQARTLVLPIKGLNIPFADVALGEGDSVEVERLVIPVFTVIGLVNKPGCFPYPPDVKYNLMQVIGLAGGTDGVADPRYAMVYRLKPDGSIACLPFEIANTNKKGEIVAAMGMLIKPGDIVAIEHTWRTRTNAFLDKVFRVSIGAYIPIVR